MHRLENPNYPFLLLGHQPAAAPLLLPFRALIRSWPLTRTTRINNNGSTQRYGFVSACNESLMVSSSCLFSIDVLKTLDPRSNPNLNPCCFDDCKGRTRGALASTGTRPKRAATMIVATHPHASAKVN